MKTHTAGGIAQNIRQLEQAGYRHNQAVAIAMVNSNIKGVKRKDKNKGTHKRFDPPVPKSKIAYINKK